jgi:putative protein-disulfide isomerase
MHLLHIADSLCSWCYGFGPELSKLLARHPGARLDLVMGGLRPFNRQKMTPEFKGMLRGDGRDVTRGDVLADIAAECGYQRDTFRMSFDSDAMREETRTDFATAQSLGVSGFPTLGTSRGEQIFLVTSGYVTDDVLEYRLAEIERLARQRSAGGAQA